MSKVLIPSDSGKDSYGITRGDQEIFQVLIPSDSGKDSYKGLYHGGQLPPGLNPF